MPFFPDPDRPETLWSRRVNPPWLGALLSIGFCLAALTAMVWVVCLLLPWQAVVPSLVAVGGWVAWWSLRNDGAHNRRSTRCNGGDV